MSIGEQIASLEELSAIDGEIRRIDEELGKQREGLEGMRSEVKGLEDRLKTDRGTLSEMDKTRNELVSELRNMTNQIEKSREKLQRSRNERESNAAQREIEELRKLHRDREDELERLSFASEAARGGIDEADQKRAQLSGELEGSQQGISSNLNELESERRVKQELRVGVVGNLPPTLYRRYESIRTRRPIAIAKTHDGICLGCHMTIPPMMFQKMRQKNEFEQCPNCRRILYYVPREAEPAGPRA